MSLTSAIPRFGSVSPMPVYEKKRTEVAKENQYSMTNQINGALTESQGNNNLNTYSRGCKLEQE